MAVTTGMSQRDGIDDTIRRRSGWLIPLGVFVVTAILSLVILIYYLVPPPASLLQERPSPTSRTDPVALSVGGVRLNIPANYILNKSGRLGGPMKAVDLITELPDFQGYNAWESQAFADNDADSNVVYILIHDEPLNLTEAERLQRVYLNFVANPSGRPGPYGLTEYAFRDDSGYRQEDLFVGAAPEAPIVLHCDRLTQQVRSPSCLRDFMLKPGVSVTYRFKRAHLGDWRAIAEGIDGLVQSFRSHAR